MLVIILVVINKFKKKICLGLGGLGVIPCFFYGCLPGLAGTKSHIATLTYVVHKEETKTKTPVRRPFDRGSLAHNSASFHQIISFSLFPLFHC